MLLNMRLKHLIKMDSIEKAAVLAKICSEYPGYEGKGSFKQIYLVCICMTKTQEQLMEEVSDLVLFSSFFVFQQCNSLPLCLHSAHYNNCVYRHCFPYLCINGVLLLTLTLGLIFTLHLCLIPDHIYRL